MTSGVATKVFETLNSDGSENRKRGMKMVERTEEEAYRRIGGLIESIPVEGLGGEGEVKLRREVFKSFLDKIYKRQK